MIIATLASDWTSFWSTVSSASGMGGVISLLAIIGVLLAVGSLLMWLWEVRKSGFGAARKSHHKLVFGFILGLALASPTIVIPVFLTLFGQIISGVIGIIHALP